MMKNLAGSPAGVARSVGNGRVVCIQSRKEVEVVLQKEYKGVRLEERSERVVH